MVKVEVNIMMFFYGGSLTTIVSYIKLYKDNKVEFICERNVLYIKEMKIKKQI